MLNEYPRPQLRRDSYMCLNGTWNYVISEDDNYNGEYIDLIEVPYPIESKLSKVGKRLNKNEYLYYKREFEITKSFKKDITLLHFGAVDQICDVYLNDKYIGNHIGGYLPFSFDISEVVKEGINTLIVRVKDELSVDLPYGKQCHNNKGMWYTPVSGIWQTVWVESVNKGYIKNIKFTPDIDNSIIKIDIDSDEKKFDLIIKEKDNVIYKDKVGNCASIKLKNVILWDCNNPFIYDVEISNKNDVIHSYFGMRQFSVDDKYIYLNNKPIFLNGVLDQGYYMDGIYTPSSYEEYEKDILTMKKMGFNALRKHIKIEPLMFYYYCDIHGMIVMQDMVNVGKYSFIKDTAFPAIGVKKKYGKVTLEQKENFINHSIETITHLYNVVSLGYYTIFNEGWGQFESDKVYDILSSVDTTRIYDSTSGWFKENKSDVDSKHIYFRPIRIKESDKPIIISEFGGYSYKVENHTYSNKSFGYKKFKDNQKYESALINLYNNQVIPSIKKGVIGSIYTQLSDVEEEINGLITYDRKVIKVDSKKVKKVMDELYKEFQKENV